MNLQSVESHLSKSDDQILLTRMRMGDSIAFEELYHKYWSQIYASAYKRIKVTEVAEEIVHDFFMSLWENREKINIHSSFKSYCHQSVKYLVFAYLHKEYSRRHYESFVVSQVSDYNNSTEEYVSLHELEERLEEALTNLPEKCRFVFELSRRQYKTNKEIARALGISEKTVENHLSKALKRLKVNLRYLLILFALVVFTA